MEVDVAWVESELPAPETAAPRVKGRIREEAAPGVPFAPPRRPTEVARLPDRDRRNRRRPLQSPPSPSLVAFRESAANVSRMRDARSAYRRRLRLLVAVGSVGLIGALVALLVSGGACNDGSTGCCKMCMGLCACGDECVPCGPACKTPMGCACNGERETSPSGAISDAAR